MFKRMKGLSKGTVLRYMLSYVLLTAILVGGISLYMFSFYRKSTYSSAIETETAVAYQRKYLADSYLWMLEDAATGISRMIEDGASARIDDTLNTVAQRIHASRLFIVKNGKLPEIDGVVFNDAEEAVQTAETLLLTAQDASDGSDVIGVYIPINSETALLCVAPYSSLLPEEYADSQTACNRYLIYKGEICAASTSFSIDEARVLRISSNINGAYTEVKRLNGREYLFVAVKSDNDDMVYASVLTITGIRAKAAGVWLGFAAVLMLIALPCVGFMVFISRKNLMPILELRSRFADKADGKTDMMSAINSGINELETHNEALRQDNIAVNRALFAKRLTGGEYENRDEAMQAARELELDISAPFFAVLLVGTPTNGVRSVYLDSIISETSADITVIGSELTETEQMLAVVFAQDVKLIDEYAQKILNMDSVRAQRLPVAISSVHEEFSDLSTAFLEATSAYESRFVMGDTRLLRFSALTFDGGAGSERATDFAKKIKEALSQGDTAALYSVLDELYAFLRTADMNLFTFRQIYNNIIAAIASEAGSPAQVYDLFSLSGCRSVEQLDAILRRVCSTVIASSNGKERQPLIQTIVRIMTENYTDSGFNLSAAAEKAGISPVRLSAELRANMGMTPMDYLTMLRMEEAKKQLRLTDLPVSAVCESSGYADPSAFTRRFKQYTGVTPLAYRQSARNEQDSTQ